DGIVTDAVGIFATADEHIIITFASVDQTHAIVGSNSGQIVNIAMNVDGIVASTAADVLQPGDVHFNAVMAFASDHGGVAQHGVFAVVADLAHGQVIVASTQVDHADAVFTATHVQVVVTLGTGVVQHGGRASVHGVVVVPNQTLGVQVEGQVGFQVGGVNQVDVPVEVGFDFQIDVTVDDHGVQIVTGPQVAQVVVGGVVDLVALCGGDVDLVDVGVAVVLGVELHVGTVDFGQVQVDDVVVTTAQGQGSVQIVGVVVIDVGIDDTDIGAVD